MNKFGWLDNQLGVKWHQACNLISNQKKITHERNDSANVNGKIEVKVIEEFLYSCNFSASLKFFLIYKTNQSNKGKNKQTTLKHKIKQMDRW